MCLGSGSDSGERSLKFLVGTTDAQKSDAKDQQEVQWHTRFDLFLLQLDSDFIIYLSKFDMNAVIPEFTKCLKINNV